MPKKSSSRMRPNRGKQIYTFIDLFAGIGGFHVAFNNTGRARCVFASEWDPLARETYKFNFSKPKYADVDAALFDSGDQFFGEDITKRCERDKIKGKVDIVCAGFPCQPFSQVGQKKGFADTRGTLFHTLKELILEKSPEAFFLENVRGLIRHGGPAEHMEGVGRTMESICNWLYKSREEGGLGYFAPQLGEGHKGPAGVYCVRASDYGVPQHRPRVFIIGFKDPEAAMCFKVPTKKQPRSGRLAEIIRRGLGREKSLQVTYDKKGIRPRKIGFTLRCGGGGSGVEDRRNWDQYYVKNAGSKDVETIRINPAIGLMLHGFPREYGFPDISLVPLAAQMRQLGNSVAVPAVESWANAIIGALDHGEQRRA